MRNIADNHLPGVQALDAQGSAVSGLHLLGRWRTLVYLASGLVLLLVSLLLVAVWLAYSRQQLAGQLQQASLASAATLQLASQSSARQMNQWLTKQAAIRQWHQSKHASTRVLQNLLVTQQLAQLTDARIEQLLWQAGQLQITLHSHKAWSDIQLALQRMPWLQLAGVQPSRRAAGWYQYQLVYTPLEPDT